MLLPEGRDLLKSFNRHETEQFCSFLSDNCPITIQTFDDRKKDKSLARIVLGTFADIYNELMELSVCPTISVSFSPRNRLKPRANRYSPPA
jgi:hypothetical protein